MTQNITDYTFSQTLSGDYKISYNEETNEEICLLKEKGLYRFSYKSSTNQIYYELKLDKRCSLLNNSNQLLFSTENTTALFLQYLSRFNIFETIVLDPNFKLDKISVPQTKLIQGKERCEAAALFLAEDNREITIIALGMDIKYWTLLNKNKNLNQILFLIQDENSKDIIGKIESIEVKPIPDDFYNFLKYTSDLSLRLVFHFLTTDEGVKDLSYISVLASYSDERRKVLPAALINKVSDDFIKELLENKYFLEGIRKVYFWDDSFFSYYIDVFEDNTKVQDNIYSDTVRLFKLGFNPSIEQWQNILTGIINSARRYYCKIEEKWLIEYITFLLEYVPEEVFYMDIAPTSKTTLLMKAVESLWCYPAVFKVFLEKSDNIFATNYEGASVKDIVQTKEILDILKEYSPIPKEEIDSLEEKRLIFNDENISQVIKEDLTPDEFSEYFFLFIKRELDEGNLTLVDPKVLCLLNKCNPKATDEFGRTILMKLLECEGYYPDVYNQIITLGTDINAVTNDGYSTLDYLMIFNPDCIDKKIAYLMNLDKVGTKNVFHSSVKNFASSEAWEALDDVNKELLFEEDDKGNTPFINAIKLRNIPAIDHLIALGGYREEDTQKVKSIISKIDNPIAKERVLKHLPYQLLKCNEF